MASWEDKVKEFLSREEEEEDELFFVIVLALLHEEWQEGGNGKKRKQNPVACVLGEYLEFKKQQSSQVVQELKEKQNHEDGAVEKCIDTLELMDDLADEEKADALELFHCGLNRQIFMKTKNPNVRRIWLKKKLLQRASTTNVVASQ